MIEKGKSVLLAILVLASLLQSYMLAYNTPNFEPTKPSQYVETNLLGEPEEAVNLVFPEQIVLHFGKNKHTVLYPDNTFYKMIFESVKQRTFDGFRVSSAAAFEAEQVRTEREGVEIRFKDGVPFRILQNVMQLKGDVLGETDRIRRIWIYTKENGEEVKAFFFSDVGSIVYEATKADLNVKDVEKFVGLGKYLTKYHTAGGDYYLPDQPLPMMKLRYEYTTFTPEQMQKSLFSDPGITRNLSERDGSEIYTDGKSGLQLENRRRWMIYTDPAAPVESRNDAKENLYSAVQFINQHGGWNGKYMLERIPQETRGEQTFIFRQYIGSYPIISSSLENFGYMKIVLQKGVVTGYERSLINLGGSAVQKEERKLPGGKELDSLIDHYSGKAMIKSVFPAYRPLLTDEAVELTPVWTVELNNGLYDVLK